MTVTPLAHWPADYPSDYAVVDVETTGLRSSDRIVSVAVELLDRAGTVTDRWSTLVDPRRDPGPVHIHGLTPERLAGAPTFDRIADDLAEYLDGRVLVAHNAPFDWGMLASEYRRLDTPWPMRRRLCTMALARHLELPIGDYKLATLAAHYRVRQLRAHDAVDDARVLGEIFRYGLHEAAGAGLPLPLTVPDSGSGLRRAAAARKRLPERAAVAKAPCPWTNPGRLDLAVGLVQGMRVAFTGDAGNAREQMERQATEAGLYVATSVSGKTSVLVTNDPGSGSGKNRAAARLGTPVIDEATYVRLLARVLPGTAVDGAAVRLPAPRTESEPTSRGGAVAEVAPVAEAAPFQAVVPPSAPAPAVESVRPPIRPTVRQVLVLQGRDEHGEGGRVRQLVLESGARLRINLTSTVDTVVVLPGAAADPRIARAQAFGAVCLTEAQWHASLAESPAPALDRTGADTATAASEGAGAGNLPRGGTIRLPGGANPGRWTLNASWAWDRPDEDIDIVAFLLDEHERVRGDSDFVFWNQPVAPLDVVALDASGPAEQTVTLELDALPRDVRRVVIAASVDGTSTFAAVGPIEIDVAPFQTTSFVRSVLDAATVERVLLLGTFYRHGAGWKFRTEGQGYEFDLAGLAGSFGVEIA
ncbi:TerD family protein [Embleya scabrispora]|uniref:TerD family protein n=1 Tax=Embleya scabrispora TaxID=159449 RepID=UPI000373E33C|nr:TerD family protein [Embleya scabrispora]MYS83019.1 DNA polymerase III [Streptomyces sp. SID5474]